MSACLTCKHWLRTMDLVVGWVDIGQRFRIDEYDGYESLTLEGDDSWFVAEDDR